MPEWTDPELLEVTVGDRPRASLQNGLVDNVAFLGRTPQVAVRLTSPQEIPSGTNQAIFWSEAVWNDRDMWDGLADAAIFIVRPGIYSVNVNVLWGETASDDLSRRAVFVERNNDTILVGDQRRHAQPTEQNIGFDTNLAENDQLTCVVRQTSGAALNVQPQRTRMTVRWVGLPPGGA